MPRLVHHTAWEVPDRVMPKPAIVPASLIAKPALQHPPGSVPKSKASPSSPDEGMHVEGALRRHVAPSGHLAKPVDVNSDGGGAPQRAEVGNRIGTVPSWRPEDRMVHRRPESTLCRDRCISDNRARLVDPASGAVTAAEGPQVGDRVRSA